MREFPIRQLKNQKGIALITVMFLFALATVIVSGLVVLSEANQQRASSILESEQASLLCLSGEEWARQLLAEDYKNNPDVDHLHEKWAEGGKILKLDNGYIELSIQDAQGKFNINNLNDSAGATNLNEKMVFQRLMDEALQDQLLSISIANQMADWLDLDKVTGTEEGDYLSQPVPYRPPNSTITDISELRLLKDVDQETYRAINQALFSSLTALPTQTAVNVNTATPQVIAALTGIGLAEAENIAGTIQNAHDGLTVASAQALFPVLSRAQNLAANTEYFEVRVRSKFSDHYAFLTSIVYRNNKSKGHISVISRDRSERFIFPFSKDYNTKARSKDYEFDI